jgi:hypothetical protein
MNLSNFQTFQVGPKGCDLLEKCYPIFFNSPEGEGLNYFNPSERFLLD